MLGYLSLMMAATLSTAAPKFAVVDVQAAMEATDHWKSAVAVLQKDRLAKQSMLEAKQKELRAKKDQLEAQKAVSDPNTIAKKEEELYKDAQILTEGFMRSQQELTVKEKRLTDQMLARVELIVRDLATAAEYDYVFESGTKEVPNVLYSPKKFDITQKVIAEYAKRYKDKPLKTEEEGKK